MTQASGSAIGFDETSSQMFDGDSQELLCPKFFDAFWDSIVDTRALIVLLWALGPLFGLSFSFPFLK